MKGSRPPEERLTDAVDMIARHDGRREFSLIASCAFAELVADLPRRLQAMAQLMVDGFETDAELAALLDCSPTTIARDKAELGRRLSLNFPTGRVRIRAARGGAHAPWFVKRCRFRGVDDDTSLDE